METADLKPIAAFDIDKGRAETAKTGMLDPEPHSGNRWLHLDLQDPGLQPWAPHYMPKKAAGALLPSDTRPRCESLSALQDHIEADRVHALGRDNFVLSVVAAIFLLLEFLIGLIGVNVAGMLGTSEPTAFWLLTGASIVGGLLLLLIFKFSKWL
ncbi:CorA family divalent cation transporter [uncultured Roseobacter sp.]|uniref:CorA family divalent cation transporter n=1 Tax=uncultured Roseobacter sp. TaxID=114847 RepID=UPI00261544F0|nr:CorA family divalent cation transporter [uncultured Roseobacter sp.]